MWRWLAGRDTAARGGLPANELLAPWPVCALLVLAANDWWLKASPAPRWLTGKLSDLAGVFVFPLVATAAVDVVLWAVSRRVDCTLRRWKLALAIALTAAGFAVLKAWPAGSAALVDALRVLAPHARVAVDPTDLVALALLPLTWWRGRRVLARGAYGRAAWARRTGRVAGAFGDAVAAGASRDTVARLESALLAGDLAAADAALTSLRA